MKLRIQRHQFRQPVLPPHNVDTAICLADLSQTRQIESEQTAEIHPIDDIVCHDGNRLTDVSLKHCLQSRLDTIENIAIRLAPPGTARQTRSP